MPVLPLLLLVSLAISTIDAGLITDSTRVARQAISPTAAAIEAANSDDEGLSLLQIFQDPSLSRAGIKQRVSSWASDNQFADLVSAFESSIRQRTLTRREQARDAAVQLPAALDTIAGIEDDLLLTPSETQEKVDRTLNGYSSKLRSLLLTAMEPTPLANSTDSPVTVTNPDDDVIIEASGDEIIDAEGSGTSTISEGSGLRLSDEEGSGGIVEGSGIKVEVVEGSGDTHLRTITLRSLSEGSGINEGSGELEGSGSIEGSADLEGSGSVIVTFPLLRDVPQATTSEAPLLTGSNDVTTMTSSLPPIQIVIDVYDDGKATTMTSAQ